MSRSPCWLGLFNTPLRNKNLTTTTHLHVTEFASKYLKEISFQIPDAFNCVGNSNSQSYNPFSILVYEATDLILNEMSFKWQIKYIFRKQQLCTYSQLFVNSCIFLWRSLPHHNMTTFPHSLTSPAQCICHMTATCCHPLPYLVMVLVAPSFLPLQWTVSETSTAVNVLSNRKCEDFTTSQFLLCSKFFKITLLKILGEGF